MFNRNQGHYRTMSSPHGLYSRSRPETWIPSQHSGIWPCAYNQKSMRACRGEGKVQCPGRPGPASWLRAGVLPDHQHENSGPQLLGWSYEKCQSLLQHGPIALHLLLLNLIITKLQHDTDTPRYPHKIPADTDKNISAFEIDRNRNSYWSGYCCYVK